jgi:ribosome recycling factor
MKVKLAEALLRRKELQQKVDQLRSIQQNDLIEVKTGRKHAHEGIDDIIAQVPKISMNQVTHAYDWHAKQLRLVDKAIQQANWTVEIELDGSMEDYVDPYVKS